MLCGRSYLVKAIKHLTSPEQVEGRGMHAIAAQHC